MSNTFKMSIKSYTFSLFKQTSPMYLCKFNVNYYKNKKIIYLVVSLICLANAKLLHKTIFLTTNQNNFL